MGIWWSPGPFDDWTLPISPWETGWGWSLATWQRQRPAEWGQTLEKHGDLGFFKIEDPQYVQYDISKGAKDDQSSDFGTANSRVPKPILGYGFLDFGINQLHSMEHLNLGNHCSCCSEKSITSCLFLWYVIVSRRNIPIMNIPIVLQLSHLIICFIPSNIPIS